MKYIGIDGGLDGGIAVYDSDDKSLYVVAMPVVNVVQNKGNKRVYDIPAIIHLLSVYENVSMVVLEKAQAFPGQGSVSMFNVGRCYGLMEGIIATMKIPYTIVHSKSWQKVMFEGNNHGDTKQTSAIVAQRLFPRANFRGTERSAKIHDGMTDAALMAYYASRI